MPRKYRVGIIGFAHMHINNLVQVFNSHPQVEWVACADTVPLNPELRTAPYTRTWNLEQTRKLIGKVSEYSDYHSMLEDEDLDIAIVAAENAQHGDVIEACAGAGVHACIEKPMASTLAEALRMARACQAAGTALIINWPTTWYPDTRKMKALIDEGVIGRVLEVRWRAGHTGPLGPANRHPGVEQETAPMSGVERGVTWWHQAAAGGGAMLDYCCYGTMFSRWFINEQATAAMGMKANLDSSYGNAEDNAAMLVRFPSAMAVLQGSWTTWDPGAAAGLIVYGTGGTLVMDYHGGGKVRLERGQGDTSLIDCPPLPTGLEDPAKELIHHLETGEAVHTTLEVGFNLEAMAILDAGVRSAASGKMELVGSPVWA
jgi:predicted dehydrogenase